MQLILAALPGAACESDSRAIAKLIEHFDEHGHRPETLLADTAYGSDENFMECARNSRRSWFGPSHNEGTVNPVIELISPTSGQEKGTTKAIVASPEQGSIVANASAAEKVSLATCSATSGRKNRRFQDDLSNARRHRSNELDAEASDWSGPSSRA